MSALTPSMLSRLFISAILYMGISLVAGPVGITQNLLAQFAGSRTGLTVGVLGLTLVALMRCIGALGEPLN